jgi:hypothetical protein
MLASETGFGSSPMPSSKIKDYMTDDERKVAEDRYEELKAKLMPPAANVDVKDITIAHARSAMNKLLWDYMYDMIIYLKWLDNPEDKDIEGWIKIRDPETTKRDAISMAKIVWNKMQSQTDDQEDWDIIDPSFQKYVVEALSDMHGGDCTAVACSCMRCHAEGVFKVPYTANWDKGTGYKMEQEFLNLKKKLGK